MKQVVQLLRSKILPWTTSRFAERLIVARPVMREADLPEGVTLSRRRLSGRRTVVKQQRIHGNQRLFTTVWPDDNLQEITVPKISCVVSGAADYLMSKYSVSCGEGTFQIIPPEMPHQRFGPYLQGSHLHNGYCMQAHAYAHSQGVLFWLTSSRNDQHINDEADNYLLSNRTLAQLLKLAVEEAVANQADSELICNNYLSAFFALAAREIENENYVDFGSKEDAHRNVRPTASFTEQVHEYIEANCHTMLKVEDVAKHMFMSNSHFSAACTRKPAPLLRNFLPVIASNWPVICCATPISPSLLFRVKSASNRPPISKTSFARAWVARPWNIEMTPSKNGEKFTTCERILAFQMVVNRV